MPVYKDKTSGTWYFQFRKVINGKALNKKGRGFKTKNEAQAAEYQTIESLKNESERNIEIKMTSTLDEVFDLYIEYRKTKVRVTTLKGNIEKYKTHIMPTFGSKLISQISPEMVQKWKSKLVSYNYSDDFTNQTIMVFRQIIQYAMQRGYKIQPDIMIEFEKVNMQKIIPEREVWTQEELEKFLNSFYVEESEEEKDYYEYFYAFSHTGMRPNEFRALQVKDIQGNYLNVNKDITSKITGAGDIIQPVKNDYSIRKVIMPEEIIKMLLKRTEGYKPTDFIFGKDKAFRESNLRRQLNKHIKLANIKPIVIYGFRHSHATHLIRSGVPIKVVSQRLGHKDVSTTMNVYWHLLKDDEMMALDVLKIPKK